MAKLMLEMKNITKTFASVKALDDVNLEVEEGEIHALVGENGAGKSTLMNIVSGVYPFGSYTGEILYNGEVCHFANITDSEKKGIVIIHQELALIPYMTIAENMFLGNERGKSFAIDWDETYDKSDKYLRIVGLHESSRTLVKNISVGKQQLVEIAKALAKNAKLLILDEPTASLNENDSKALLELMLKFKKEGMTSIIISHKLNEISYVADKITIIRDGTTIETLNKSTDTITESRIIKGMVGRSMSDRFPKREKDNVGEIALEIEDWNVYHSIYTERKVVNNVSMNFKKGEVVGIAGLMGAGRTELAMSVFGKSYGTNISGKIKINGEVVHLHNVNDAIKHKLAYVTEDRKGNGLILSNSIKRNTTLANLAGISKLGIIDSDKEYEVALKQKEKLNIKCRSIEQNAGDLSGGNQQKTLLAKWMFADPDILILDEPTRGIDVGAKFEIYCIINQLVSIGKSVIMISSELAEVIGMCNRIYVMDEGRLVGEVAGEEATQENIMAHILKTSSKGV
ncbi:sugar ABC transporter ATP-binding protein [[Clostridium] fimetarium]|uniref:Putative multiple sugar transport system ATP-binding protein n=1 Tax=[Clostridium] fimetarium TaxID=99656 RepID=A0A1I0MVE1_9FIRM|nr:sugar ABC transporter ATP-binding protein [[Clostridium] fimetarium]SEV92528.1 putative multiple sugar transport system ATP-binding protein [[Clostridium] fimetarium]